MYYSLSPLSRMPHLILFPATLLARKPYDLSRRESHLRAAKCPLGGAEAFESNLVRILKPTSTRRNSRLVDAPLSRYKSNPRAPGQRNAFNGVRKALTACSSPYEKWYKRATRRPARGEFPNVLLPRRHGLAARYAAKEIGDLGRRGPWGEG